jgi:hypothetical protein
MPTELLKYATPRRFVESFPNLGLSLQALRWLLFHRQVNGLEASGAILKLGQRRLLIDVEKFHEWLQQQNGNGGWRQR